MAISGAGLYGFATAFFQTNDANADHFSNGFDVISTLIPEDRIDSSYLNTIALNFEKLMDLYHIPRNLTGNNWVYPPASVYFNYSMITGGSDWKFFNSSHLINNIDIFDLSRDYNDLDIMTYTRNDLDHTSGYAGVYVAAEAFRYAVAKREHNKAEKIASLERLNEMVDAYEILSEVAGNYTWPRYAIPDTPLARKRFTNDYFENPEHVVEYRGYNWTLVGHKSRDLTCLHLLAMSMVYNLVDDANIKRRTGNIIDRTVHYLYESNWRVLDVDGVQHTSAADLMGTRYLPSSMFILTFLKMASIVNPTRWQSIYQHYAYDRGFIKALEKEKRAGLGYAGSHVFGAYYALNFPYNNVPTLIWLEQDPQLKQMYIDLLLDPNHNFAKFHRNANFDVIYLLCHSTPNFNDLTEIPELTPSEINEDDQVWGQVRDTIKDPLAFVKWDIKDCLWRYAKKKYPNRNYPIDVINFPNNHHNPIDGDLSYYPKIGYWQGEGINLEDYLYDLIEGRTPSGRPTYLLNNSMPVDMRKGEEIMWQRRSFDIRSVNDQNPSNPGWEQMYAVDFLYIYWVARYLNIL